MTGCSNILSHSLLEGLRKTMENVLKQVPRGPKFKPGSPEYEAQSLVTTHHSILQDIQTDNLPLAVCTVWAVIRDLTLSEGRHKLHLKTGRSKKNALT